MENQKNQHHREHGWERYHNKITGRNVSDVKISTTHRQTTRIYTECVKCPVFHYYKNYTLPKTKESQQNATQLTVQDDRHFRLPTMIKNQLHRPDNTQYTTTSTRGNQPKVAINNIRINVQRSFNN